MPRIQSVVTVSLCLHAAQARAQFPATISLQKSLNTNAATDTGDDARPAITTDGHGTWIAVWGTTDDLGGTIGTDGDILAARSTDNGTTWSAPAPVNGNAGSDTGADEEAQIA